MGERERPVRSGDTLLGDLLRGATPSMTVSNPVNLSGDSRLGERRSVASSIAWAVSIAEAVLS
jgi:hypothetical protein